MPAPMSLQCHYKGSSALALGGLHDFLQLLFTANSKLAKSYTLQEWAKHLLDYAELLFPAESIEAAAQQAEKQQINEIFLLLSEEFSAVHNQP
jgi:exodeoxyribonuclease V gamma subunit